MSVHQFVDHLRLSDQRERVGLPVADVKNLEKSYKKAKWYNFFLPADTDPSLAARTIRHELSQSRLTENLKKNRANFDKLR